MKLVARHNLVIRIEYVMFEILRNYYAIALSDLRYQGMEVLLWRVLIKTLSPLMRLDLQILFDFDLCPVLPQPTPKAAMEITRADESDIDEILDMQMPRMSSDEIQTFNDTQELQYAQLLRVRSNAFDVYRRSMRAGERCYVARVNGAIAHSNWIRFHDNGPIEGRPVQLQPGEVYTTDAYTSDASRGQGIHEAVLTHMLQVAQQMGCKCAYTITDLTKAGSRRGVQRVGWKYRGSILYVTPRLLKRTWLVRTGGDIEPLFEHARAAMRIAD